ncbi:MAG: YraN family protein [Nocardioidaceae bacterium]
MTATHAQRKALGDFGERVAARYLDDLGMVLLDRNWRCPDGEIDIVARDGVELVVCEVKTRSSARFGTPLEAITAQKASRLHRLGRAWLSAHPDHPRFGRLRIDVVTVTTATAGAAEVEHIAGVV